MYIAGKKWCTLEDTHVVNSILQIVKGLSHGLDSDPQITTYKVLPAEG